MTCSLLRGAWLGAVWGLWTGCGSELQHRASEPWKFGQVWVTDFAQALTQARAEDKLVLVNFTGSDWCPGCQALRVHILNTPGFAEFAKAHLVLIEIDFPRRTLQTGAQQQANEALAAKYQVESFPTVLVLDGDGKILSREVGYSGVSPQAYVAALRQMRK